MCLLSKPQIGFHYYENSRRVSGIENGILVMVRIAVVILFVAV